MHKPWEKLVPKIENADLPNLEEIEDVGKSTPKYMFRRYGKAIKLAVMAAIAVDTSIFLLVKDYEISVQVAILTLVILTIIYAVLARVVSHVFMKQFAEANDFSYEIKGELADKDGVIFEIGHSKDIEDIIRGQFKGHPIELFNYYYVIGSGKHRQEYYFTVMRVKYNTLLPHLFLKDRKDNFGSALTFRFKNEQKISLEGDFDKYFVLFAPRGLQHEALQIFTPDFMHDMKEKWNDFSLEFINSHIYIYHYWKIDKKQELYNLYALAKYLIEAGPKLAAMHKGLISTSGYFPNRL